MSAEGAEMIGEAPTTIRVHEFFNLCVIVFPRAKASVCN
jgi:hypothetical protein